MRAEPERGEVCADDERELPNGVAEEVARGGRDRELVDEPRRRDGEHRPEHAPHGHARPLQEMAAAMMMLSPRMTEPMRIASATFWSSSISLRSENGETARMITKLTANIKMPTAEYAMLETSE